MIAPAAIDVEVQEVLDWIRAVLPSRGALRVLEVGCGPGHLARQLLDAGVHVTAIDVDAEQVRAARERGVPAVTANFLSFEGSGFDALLFTRSLHHISPLAAAIEKMDALLEPGGLILADEFAHDELNAVTAAWFWDLLTVLEEAGALAPDVTPGHHHQGRPDDPLQRWHDRHLHDPPLHGAAALIAALSARFELRMQDRGPYLHRYLSERVSPSEAGTRLFLRVRALERLRVGQGLVIPIGLRLVARKPPQGI